MKQKKQAESYLKKKKPVKHGLMVQKDYEDRHKVDEPEGTFFENQIFFGKENFFRNYGNVRNFDTAWKQGLPI